MAGICSGNRLLTYLSQRSDVECPIQKQKAVNLPCVLQGSLLYRDMSSHSMAAIKINPETLEQEGTITMPGTNPCVSWRACWCKQLLVERVTFGMITFVSVVQFTLCGLVKLVCLIEA